MIYNPSKIPAMSRMCFDKGVALVVVGFPATPLLLARARVCISASHTKEDLEYCLQVIDEVTTKLHMKYSLMDANTSEMEMELQTNGNGHHHVNGNGNIHLKSEPL